MIRSRFGRDACVPATNDPIIWSESRLVGPEREVGLRHGGFAAPWEGAGVALPEHQQTIGMRMGEQDRVDVLEIDAGREFGTSRPVSGPSTFSLPMPVSMSTSRSPVTTG